MSIAPPREAWHLGIIGGSGLAAIDGLEDAQEIAVASSFGAPSGPVVTGRLGGVRVTFLARHGAGHHLPPAAVNYRANIDVLKRCGVSDVLAISAVGSLREAMAPGDLVLVDQFIDRTSGRAASFFGPGCVAHVGFAEPVCPRLSRLVGAAAEQAGGTVHRPATYIAIDGPRFSTRAESALYRRWGADVIGMTAMPEATLCREAELPYALLALVTDYDGWDAGRPPVDAATVVAQVAANAALAQRTLKALVANLPAARAPVPADTALEHALMTAPAARDPALLARLDAVAGRVMNGAGVGALSASG